MPRCKAPEILRNEAYLDVRRNDEGLGKRRRWAFFSSVLSYCLILIRVKMPASPKRTVGVQADRKGVITPVFPMEMKM